MCVRVLFCDVMLLSFLICFVFILLAVVCSSFSCCSPKCNESPKCQIQRKNSVSSNASGPSRDSTKNKIVCKRHNRTSNMYCPAPDPGKSEIRNLTKESKEQTTAVCQKFFRKFVEEFMWTKGPCTPLLPPCPLRILQVFGIFHQSWGCGN